jgi:hypothetical protein
MQLLQGWEERPTPARALQHPWLKGTCHSINGVIADKKAEKDVEQHTLCYMLAVLMLPLALPYRDFEQLRSAFQDNDQDSDGLVPRHIVQRILRSRCAVKEAVDAAIKIADVNKSDVHDLCSIACADLMAREFFASGPTGQPPQGPFRAAELAPQMAKRFLEIIGSRQGNVSLNSIKMKLKTATARDLHTYAEVNYKEIYSLFPTDDPIDPQLLRRILASSGGIGTPLASEDFGRKSSEENFEFGGFFNLLGQCGVGSMKRETSPHSVLVQ